MYSLVQELELSNDFCRQLGWVRFQILGWVEKFSEIELEGYDFDFYYVSYGEI